MNEIVKINNEELQIKEWNGKRVVTLSDVDRVHARPIGTAKKNFQNNKDYFSCDVDYFEITRKELREKFSPNSAPLRGNPSMKTYLFTESGYLLLVKSFTDELAWKVQRDLVNTYFKFKEVVENFNTNFPIDTNELTTLFKDTQRNLPSVFSQISTMENLFEQVIDNMTLNTRQQEIIHERVRERIRTLLGGAHSSTYKKYSRSYMINLWNAVKENFHCGSSYKDMNPKDFEKAIEFIKRWEYED